VLDIGHGVRLQPGEVFFSQGDRSSTTAVVLRGHLKMSAVGSSGRCVLLTFWGPGDFAGHVTVINGTSRMGTAVAIDPVDLWVMPAAGFADLLVQHPEVNAPIVRQLASWVESAARCQAVQGTESATIRIARLLVEIGDPGVGGSRGQRGGAALHLTQDELGQIVGVSRESVARVLREFRARGLVSTGRQRLIVHRPDELAQIARLATVTPGGPVERLVRLPPT
jgi:CRP/FNR family transcriptional regulator, cyclic AMP receptor protein